ncbi:hypothetical protein HY489_00790 [Candidatus Woesearchaeota archaeon]|nr:hypothetical protein [Candidatus Woesearchaeota archaeon]
MTVVKEVEYQAVLAIARILYVAGLTALIPLIPMVLSPQQLMAAKYGLLAALFLIIASFITVFLFTRSKKASVRAIGFMTIIPGFLAVAFALIGEKNLVGYLVKLGPVTPFVQAWLDNYLPKSWFLAGIYIILGVSLVYLSEKLRR